MSSGDSPAEPDRVVSVIPLVPSWRLDRALDYRVPQDLADTLVVGSLVAVPLGTRNVRGIVVGREPEESSTELQAVKRVIVADPLAPPPLDELFDWIARRYAVPRPKAFARVVPPRVRISRPLPPDLRVGPEPARLTAYTGARDLWTAINSERAGTWLLQCVPGEDRGLLIAELATAALKSEGATLVAVPEVAHGSRVIDELTHIFGDVARVDSAVGDAERARGWLRLAADHPLGAGGRSTVLAPAARLRLLVLDEEHHRSYKEDRSPRYDARRVARERARLQGAVCVFISSSPTVDMGAAALAGNVGWVRPARDQERAARPIVEVVEPPADRAVSALLHDRIKKTLAAGGRVALLASARGYARVVWCAACRRSLRCERCETPMASDRSTLACPACGHVVAPFPPACPYCSSPKLVSLGAGSERVAEQLSAAFPRARVRHVDTATREATSEKDGAPDIYVTTWIGTKEVLRPNVTMVGVLNADALIRRPDWRAAEDAYHALAEMADWTGPAASGGRLVIQTSDPRHHSVQAIARADYRYFLENEIEQRRELRYPPHTELIRITVRGSSTEDLISRIAEAARALSATVLGPMPVAARRFTRVGPGKDLELLLKCDDAQTVAEALRDILASVRGGDSVSVDVDPI